MTTHTLYAGPAFTGWLMVTACLQLGRSGPVWFAKFRYFSRPECWLDRVAVWIPQRAAWDQCRWNPSRLTSDAVTQIPPAVLADVETWLRGRPVGEAEATTTTETDR
jgi:hypothetical protein